MTGSIRLVAGALAYAVLTLVAILFVFPYWWMLIGAFRSTRAMMTAPLRLLPESLDLSIFGQIARIGGVDFWVYIGNSFLFPLKLLE